MPVWPGADTGHEQSGGRKHGQLSQSRAFVLIVIGPCVDKLFLEGSLQGSPEE